MNDTSKAPSSDRLLALMIHSLHTDAELKAAGIDTSRRTRDPNDVVPGSIMAYGFTALYAFHPERVKSTEAEIVAMLDTLQDEFFTDGGFSAAFINTIKGTLDPWGTCQDSEALLVLATATGHARIETPRVLWDFMPGSAPFVRFSKVALVEAPTSLEA